MRRFTLRGFFLCVLALWMQLLAPAAAMSPPDAADPFAVICSHDASGQDAPGQGDHGRGDHGQQHQHCLLCQAAFSSPPLSDRTPTVVPARPIVRRLAWRPGLARAPPAKPQPRPQPRGPPILL